MDCDSLTFPFNELSALDSQWANPGAFIQNGADWQDNGAKKDTMGLETRSPMGNDRSPWSQHNVWRHHNLRCSKADNSELETVTRN